LTIPLSRAFLKSFSTVLTPPPYWGRTVKSTLEFHTNLVTHDSIGHYSIKPELVSALEMAIEEQENSGNVVCPSGVAFALSLRKVNVL